MKKRTITEENIAAFENYMLDEERSKNTIEKELRDVRKLKQFSEEQPITKQLVIAYKEELQNAYKPRSVNSMLASVNSFFSFMGWQELRVKGVRIQQEAFCPEDKNLSQAEYERLCNAAEEAGRKRDLLLLQTMAGTGIRVSEVRFITVEACRQGVAMVTNKGKTRVVLIPNKLKKKLLCFSAEQKIKTGPIFVSRNGRPIDRVAIWKILKSLCADAKVKPEKVFPHNLRHLFARAFHRISRDLSKLADVLGHSNVNTTRLYVITTEQEHRSYLEKMRLIS